MNPDWHALSESYRFSASQTESLVNLFQLLKTVSDRNLTAVTTDSAIFNVHFLDSLSLLRFPELTSSRMVVDIGSGAGFPGLPLAIALPEIDFSLVESNRKKSDFIRSAIKKIGIENATVENERAEDMGKGPHRGVFDAALARAVASLPVVLEYAIPLLKVGGRALLQRGARSNNDHALSLFSSSELGAELSRIESIQSYPDAKNLHVWIFKKIAETPSRYPRRSGVPAKKPIEP